MFELVNLEKSRFKQVMSAVKTHRELNKTFNFTNYFSYFLKFKKHRKNREKFMLFDKSFLEFAQKKCNIITPIKDFEIQKIYKFLLNLTSYEFKKIERTFDDFEQVSKFFSLNHKMLHQILNYKEFLYDSEKPSPKILNRINFKESNENILAAIHLAFNSDKTLTNTDKIKDLMSLDDKNYNKVRQICFLKHYKKRTSDKMVGICKEFKLQLSDFYTCWKWIEKCKEHKGKNTKENEAFSHDSYVEPIENIFLESLSEIVPSQQVLSKKNEVKKIKDLNKPPHALSANSKRKKQQSFSSLAQADGGTKLLKTRKIDSKNYEVIEKDYENKLMAFSPLSQTLEDFHKPFIIPSKIRTFPESNQYRGLDFDIISNVSSSGIQEENNELLCMENEENIFKRPNLKLKNSNYNPASALGTLSFLSKPFSQLNNSSAENHACTDSIPSHATSQDAECKPINKLTVPRMLERNNGFFKTSKPLELDMSDFKKEVVIHLTPVDEQVLMNEHSINKKTNKNDNQNENKNEKTDSVIFYI